MMELLLQRIYNMEEIWKPIPNTNDLYEASNFGNIRSKNHVDHRNRPWPGKVLKQFRNGKQGYLGVTINRKSQKTHRLVCAAFFGDRDSKTHVNHKNGIRSDNRVDNLEWCTAQENAKHSYGVLGRKSSGGHKGKTGFKHHASKTVKAINLLTKETIVFGSTAEAARQIGLASGVVPRVCSGEYKSAKDWAFEYL